MNDDFFGDSFYKLEKNESNYNRVMNGGNNFNGALICADHSVRHSMGSNAVNTLFFSKDNINNIQNKIIELVYKKSNGAYKINRQSDKQL